MLLDEEPYLARLGDGRRRAPRPAAARLGAHAARGRRRRGAAARGARRRRSRARRCARRALGPRAAMARAAPSRGAAPMSDAAERRPLADLAHERRQDDARAHAPAPRRRRGARPGARHRRDRALRPATRRTARSLVLADNPGFGDSVRLLRRLRGLPDPLAWLVGQVWDRFRRPAALLQPAGRAPRARRGGRRALPRERERGPGAGRLRGARARAPRLDRPPGACCS